jgi:PAS domain S-box-containing protein
MENLFYPLISLIPALLNLGILVYLLFYVPRVKTTDIFCFFVLLLFLWQAEDTIVRLCKDAVTALFWVQILCIGWAGVAPVLFHFACRYTSQKLFHSRFSLVCLYLPFVVFYLLYIATCDTSVFTHRSGWHWIVTPRPGTADGIQRLFISMAVIGAVYILFQYAFKIRNQKRKRLQALFISLGIFIPAVQGIVTQIVFPVILDKPDIPLTSSFLTLFSIATILSLSKYNLFNISESVDVKTVLANLKNIVLVVSPNHQVIYMNPFALETFGNQEISEEEINLNTIFASPSYYESFLVDSLRPSFKGETVRDYATIFSTSSGEKMDVLVSTELISNNNQVQGVLLVANDVTELIKMMRDLERSNKELERFAYVASHDLQEPLRKISMYLQMLEMNFKDKIDEKGRKYIDIAVNSGSQMRNLIEDLLEYSHLSFNNDNPGNTDMNLVIEKVIKSFTLQIQESGAQIEYGKLPLLQKVDQSQMLQLLQNLISNAIKYRSSERQPYVRIRADDSGEFWRFAVEDNGIGIEPGYREKVFVVFQRLHSKGQYQGTGIGLSICKKIVEHYGGRIWIESNLNGGSIFYFTIQKNIS